MFLAQGLLKILINQKIAFYETLITLRYFLIKKVSSKMKSKMKKTTRLKKKILKSNSVYLSTQGSSMNNLFLFFFFGLSNKENIPKVQSSFSENF